ncbi:T9SS sorting signal type C domain-containing protein [Flavobacterium sp.]|uniref:T9SS sorting signal type C domain-containing protein n=1 Tax=Flavobacterium sp. TaxID=239 RepID=UPI003F69CED4
MSGSGNKTLGASVIAAENDLDINGAANLIVNSDETLHVKGDFKNNSGTAFFENNASLVQDGDGISNNNIGEITYRRTTRPLKHLDFVYWGSMVDNQTILGIWMSNAAENFYRFDSTVGTTGQWTVVGGGQILNPTVGYITRARYNSGGWAPDPLFTYPWDASFVGRPRSGDYPVALSSERNHLLSNPYPSTVDFDAFALQGAADYASSPFVPTIYYWTQTTPITANQYAQNDYATYTAPLGTGISVGSDANIFTASRYIASGQGFFIRTKAGATSASFKNSHRAVSNNENFAKSSNQVATNATPSDRSRYWLNLTNSLGDTKQLAVVHTSMATNALDVDYDAVSFNGNSALNFYSVLENKNIVIQGRNLLQTTDVVPLGFNAVSAGNYTISLTNFDGVFASGQDIFLEDTQTNIIHDLKASSYTFASVAGVNNARFNIVYTNAALSNPNFENDNQIVIASDENVTVYSTVENISKIEVYDLLGRNVITLDNLSSTTVILDKLKPTNAPLIVKSTLSNGLQITKKIIY